LCVYVYLLDLFLHRENMKPLSFCTFFTFIWFPPFNPFTFTPHSVMICYGWVKPHCLHIPHFLHTFISCRVSGIFALLMSGELADFDWGIF
jgi:hypothetical protein